MWHPSPLVLIVLCDLLQVLNVRLQVVTAGHIVAGVAL
jgi:hypothetical protein